MNFFNRFITRLKFRRTIRTDESSNVVDSIAKARKLYKNLCIVAHPDKHPSKKEFAEDIMQRITANKHNYSVLKSLEMEIAEKLK